MFYEETIINGVLYWRSTPNGEWIQKTPEQLTKRLMAGKNKLQDGGYEPAPYYLNPQFKMPPASA